MSDESNRREGTSAAAGGTDQAAAAADTGRSTSTDTNATGQDRPVSDAFRAIPAYLSELVDYVWHYLHARADGVHAALRRAIIYALLGVLGLLVFAALLVAASVLLLEGVAGWIGMLCGDRPWAGNLIVGVVVLAGVAAALRLALLRLVRKWKLQTERKYEELRNQQRSQHGRDATQRAGQYTRQ